MYEITFYAFMLAIGGSLLNVIRSFEYTTEGAKLAAAILYCVIAFIWGSVLLYNVVFTIREQIEDFYALGKIEKEKESYKNEMQSYKVEMREHLLDKYKDFEEQMMQKVVDSKIIATLLEKSGYSSVLQTYDRRMTQYLDQINNSDRRIATTIKDMKVRQSNSISGFAFLIPKKFRYEDPK